MAYIGLLILIVLALIVFFINPRQPGPPPR